jgi:hypothetical protein
MKATIARLEKRLRPERLRYCLRVGDDGLVEWDGRRIRPEELPGEHDYTLVSTRVVTRAPDGALVRVYPGVEAV